MQDTEISGNENVVYVLGAAVNIFCIRVPGCILCNKITFWEKSIKLV